MNRGSALEVRYVGNEAQHIWFSENLNEVNIFENGFLTEFKNAQNNLAINQANGKGTSFANNGLAGQVALPIFAAAFGTTSGSLYNQFTTQFQTGAAGSVARSLAGTQSYICNMFGAKFSPCASRNLGGAGTSYPINFFEVNPFTAGGSLELPGFHGPFQLPQPAGGVPPAAEPRHAVQRELHLLALAGGRTREWLPGQRRRIVPDRPQLPLELPSRAATTSATSSTSAAPTTCRSARARRF